MLDVSTNSPKVPPLFFSSDKLAPGLAQARADKEARPELADPLYKQAEENLLKSAEQQGIKPSDSEGLLTQHDQSETPEQTALRQCIAEVYFEHGEVFDQLKQADQAKACYQKAQAWGHADAAMQLNRSLSASDLRFSLGQLPTLPVHYLHREESTQLLTWLKEQPIALIEVIGPSGVGKTTLIQSLIRPRPDPFFASYALIAWVDCSSVSRAYADIQAISHALGYDSPNPQAALQRVASYVQEHSNSLLILDGLAPSNVDFVLTWLNPSVWSGQLIYTTTQTLVDTLSQSLERPVKSLPLSLFTPDQAKDLVQQWLPKEPLEGCDFTQFIRMTDGYPGVIQALCRYYQTTLVSFRSFADFLAQPEKYQGVRDTLLSEIVQANLGLLEQEAVTNQIAARALNLIKQAAWLGDHRIPFEFFVNEQQVDQDALQMLYDKQRAILDIDRGAKNLKLNPAFLSMVQKRYLSEQRPLFEKNIQRLSKVFSYLTDNESVNGSHSQPENLKHYADLVHTILFETITTVSLSDNPSLLSQVLTLGSSLARLYYLYHGELQLAYDCLQRAQRFFKQGLSEEQIAHFEVAPEDFTAPSITQEETELLKLYAQEYLYQAATIASQLVSRGQVAVEVIQDFEKSRAVQINLGQHGDPKAIAYTLRNLTRALRKQGLLLNALEEYQALTRWMDQYPAVFDERERAEILVDQGIIQKELEDAKPENQQSYQPAIDTLHETQRIYLKNETANQRQALGMLSIYLGEAYLAAGNFEAGITHTCQILYYEGTRRERQARAYFNLARAFDKAGYVALAKLFIDKAFPLQIKAFQPTTEALQLKIEQKLLQRQHQDSLRSIYDQTATLETKESLAAYCEAQLLEGSAPSKLLSRSKIQAIESAAYAWLQQHHSKETIETQLAALILKTTALEVQEKTQAEKRALQLQQDELWYRALAQRVDLDTPENRHALLFANTFKEELLYQIVQQLRHANGEAMPMDKATLAEGLIEAVSGALPKIELSATTGVTGTVDLAAIVQGVTKTYSEWHASHKDADSKRVIDPLQELEQQSKSLQVCARIQQQIEEMAYYAARCWQPVFLRQNWHEPKDIQTLAEYGALRMMEYLKIGRADTLSSQERVVLALMTGEANTSLKQHEAGKPGQLLKGRWSVQGFFAKPGINIEMEKEVYLPSWQARPDIYGYRYGSPVEARTRPYQGPFKNEAEAKQRAEAAQHQQSRCAVM